MAAPLKLTFLDPLHDGIKRRVRSALPPDWRVTFASGSNAANQARAIRDADVVFVIGMGLPKSLLDSAKSLKFVQKLGAGVDNIDVTACGARGIGLAKIQGGNATPVAEHSLLLMLAALRRLPVIDRQVREGGWPREECRGLNGQISGRQVGIVGFGAIGKAVARLLTGFGARVVFYDPVACDPQIAASLNAVPLPLENLLATSDIVTLHFPLSAENRNFMNARRVGLMKRGAILINCARGGVLDEAAVSSALQSGALGYAAFDVFSQEPPVCNPILTLPNTIVTPHTAGGTVDNFVNILTRGISNTQAYLAGQPIPQGDLIL